MTTPTPHPLEVLHRTLEALEASKQQPTAEATSEGRPVDLIAIKKAGGFVFVSPAEWSQIDTESRIAAIKEQRVIFLSEEEPVSVRSALEWLKLHPDGMTT